MAATVLDSRLRELVDPDAEAEKIASGYTFTEGPVWHPRERHLTFSDIYPSVMYRWTEEGGAAVYRQPSGQANGNTYDRDGNLITCEHEGRRVSRTRPDGTVETVADRFDGRRLNSPNDVVCTPNGDLIFTDPAYGLRQPDGSFLPGELDFNGVFRVSARDGTLSLLARDFQAPNGLVVTDGGAGLLVDDTRQGHVRVFEIGGDGSLDAGRVFCEVRYGDRVGRPDGMKLDAEGNLYVAANTDEGVWVFDRDGILLGFIGIPERPANLAWGEDDGRTLFVTAQTSVYRLRMKVKGQPLQLT